MGRKSVNHTKPEMAQHEIVELLMQTQQFLTHSKENLCLLDSLVEESNIIPKTTHIVFLQQAVESVPNLWQVCVMDTIWRQKTGSTSTLSYQSYFDLLKSAAYHHNITANSAVK